MSQGYWMIFTKEPLGWAPQFGDFDRATVRDEMRDEYAPAYPVARRVMLRLEDDSQDAADYAVRMLDRHGPRIRVH